MNPTFRQLRVFTEVVRLGSMARAAETLHLTPPAVSMQVKELESQVGLPLFDRIGRQVRLTTAGEYFVVHARRLLAALKEADDQMQRFLKAERGQLAIGIVGTAKYFVPALLARFHAEHPGVEVRLELALNREELVERLRRGEVDLCIMGRPPKDLDARAEVFATHPLVVVAPTGHPLLEAPQAPASALARYPFIVREPGSGTRAAMEAFFEHHHVQPQVAMQLPSTETIKQAVIAGMGLGFMSLHTIWLELEAGLLHLAHVEGTPVLRTWNLVRLSARVLSPAAEMFRYLILEHAQNHLAAQDAKWVA